MKKLAVLVMLALVACGGPLKYQPKPTARAPEADAKVVANIAKDTHTTRLSIELIHLAPPGRIQDGAKTYMVWQRRASEGPWTRIGALTYNEGSREGKLEEATVPEVSFDMLISAEEKIDAATPSAHVIIEQKVNKE
jgi:hypothetical protein